MTPILKVKYQNSHVLYEGYLYLSLFTVSPPSYEECMAGNYEIKDDEGNPMSSSRNPVFPYYDWKKQTSYTGPPPSTVRLFPSHD